MTDTNIGERAAIPKSDQVGRTNLAFTSVIDGNPEIMVVTEEGRKVRRITDNPAEDVVPGWSRPQKAGA